MKPLFTLFFLATLTFGLQTYCDSYQTQDCPAKDLIREKLKKRLNENLPTYTDFCKAINDPNQKVREQAVLSFAKALDDIDNPRNYFDFKPGVKLSEDQEKGVRLALRSLAYGELYGKIKPNPGSGYFLGASIMTISILNMHSRLVLNAGSIDQKSLLGKIPTRPNLGDIVTFGPLYQGNRQILLDFGVRVSILSQCNTENKRPDLGDLNISRILNKNLPDQYTLQTDQKACNNLMTSNQQNKNNWEIKLVDCEQEMAQILMYDNNDFKTFSVATKSILSTYNIAAPISSDVPNDLTFESIYEYWKHSQQSTPSPQVFSNIFYRTPWLKRNLSMLEEVANKENKYDSERLLDDEARQAALYLAPLLNSQCVGEIAPFVIHRRQKGPSQGKDSTIVR